MRALQRALTVRVRYRYTSQQGRAGPIYGHDDTYEGLGIFFDTFEDAENGTAEPFVVAMMNYGKPIGEGDTPDYYDNQVGVCFASYRNLPNMMAARIVWSDGRGTCTPRMRRRRGSRIGGCSCAARRRLAAM